MELSCLGLTIICRDRIYFGLRISLPGDCSFGVDGDVASGSVIGCSVVLLSVVLSSVVLLSVVLLSVVLSYLKSLLLKMV